MFELSIGRARKRNGLLSIWKSKNFVCRFIQLPCKLRYITNQLSFLLLYEQSRPNCCRDSCHRCGRCRRAAVQCRRSRLSTTKAIYSEQLVAEPGSNPREHLSSICDIWRLHCSFANGIYVLSATWLDMVGSRK